MVPARSAVRFLVLDNGRVGYMDQRGQLVIPVQFETGRAFSDGVAAVRVGKRQWRFIDTSGAFATPDTYQSVGNFHEGYARVEVNGKWGVVARSGKLTVAPKYEWIWKVGEGFAAFKRDGKYGLVDVQGNETIAPRYDHISPPDDGRVIAKVDGRYLFLDTSGAVILDPHETGDVAWSFSEGLTPVRMDTRRKGSKKARYRWGYLNTSGHVVLPAKYVRAHRFSEGLASVETDAKMGFLFGYIDTKGTLVIPPKWHHTEPFSEGLAVVKVGEKFGFIDTSGHLAIEAQFDWAQPFKDGLAWVELHDCDDRFRDNRGVCSQGRRDRIGYIDTRGQWVRKPALGRP